MKELYNIQPMTNTDIKEALKLLKMGIEKGYIKYTHANPIEQNCYISSGSIEGLYFPNSRMNFGHSLMRFVCIAKINAVICVIHEWLEDCPRAYKGEYESEPLEGFAKSREQIEIEHTFKNSIAGYEEAIKDLEKIKRVRTKDGSDFKTLSRNFEGCYQFVVERSAWNSNILWVKLGSQTLYLHEEKTSLTADEVEALINDKKDYYADMLKKKRTALKKAPQRMARFFKQVASLREWINSLDKEEYYTYKELFEKAVSSLYRKD